MDSGNYYYSSPMGTPPKTPGSGPKNLYYPKLNSAPFTPGYFTPPDSRENSPSLGGTSPNPQGQSTFLLPPTPGTSPQTPSFAQCSGRIPRRALPATTAAAAAAVLQREESFGSLQLELLAEDALHYSGSHGTFGRLDSHRYQKHDPPRTGNPTRSPDLRRYKSNASTIIPLPSTVYVPGVGDSDSASASGHPSKTEHHTFHDREERSHFSICDTPLSPPTSFPFLPVEPAIPTISARDAPRPTSPVSPPAGLTGLWNSAQRTEKTPGPAIDGGKTYELTMYRQTPQHTSEHSPALAEHYTFGLTPETPFYTLYAMREDPTDQTFNELSFLRRDPGSGLETSVITLGLESPSDPTSGDGLIALIYPKEAVLSAMTPVTPTRDAAGRSLRIRGNEERAREAIQKAYATECCRLSWDAERRRFYLYHPGVADFGDAYLVDIQGDVGFDAVGGATGSIKLLNVDTNETLAELDFGRSVLLIDTCATAKIPSAYIVDVAVATVLTIAVVESRRLRLQRMDQLQFAMPRQAGREKRRWRALFSAFSKVLCF